jgi:hypothetical protein
VDMRGSECRSSMCTCVSSNVDLGRGREKCEWVSA